MTRIGQTRDARDIISRMSWEAYRWTAKSPSELFHVLGPHGVDHLVRQALDACWRELPDDRRTLGDVVTAWMMMPRTGGRKVGDVSKIVTRIFDRNLAAWEEDNATLTGKKASTKKKPAAKKSPPAKSKSKAKSAGEAK